MLKVFAASTRETMTLQVDEIQGGTSRKKEMRNIKKYFFSSHISKNPDRKKKNF